MSHLFDVLNDADSLPQEPFAVAAVRSDCCSSRAAMLDVVHSDSCRRQRIDETVNHKAEGRQGAVCVCVC